MGSDFYGHAAINTPSSTAPVTDINTLISPSSGWVLTQANSVNDNSQIVGAGTLNGQTHAFLYHGGTVNDLGQGSAIAINDAGQVTGTMSVGGNSHAFLYSGGITHDLGTLAGNLSSNAMAINANGQIVGYSGSDAFLYSNGVMTDLNALINPSSGWVLENAVGINALGQIIGTGTGPNGSTAFLLTPVPEPSSFILAVLALTGLTAWRRRRGATRSSALVAILSCAAFALPITHSMATVVPPVGLAPGSQYQLIFVTADTSTGTSTDIATYNAFVRNEAALNPSLPSGVTWDAVASTGTVNAKDNAPSGELPIYNTAGLEVAESNLYSLSLVNPIGYDQYGNLAPQFAKAFTGSDTSGVPVAGEEWYLGSPQQAASYGFAGSVIAWANLAGNAVESDSDLSLYALSTAITVPTPEPATITLLGSALFVLSGIRFLRLRKR